LDTGIGAYVVEEPVVGSDTPRIKIHTWVNGGPNRDQGYDGTVIIHGPRGLPSR
jgi:hypothetical protein